VPAGRHNTCRALALELAALVALLVGALVALLEVADATAVELAPVAPLAERLPEAPVLAAVVEVAVEPPAAPVVVPPVLKEVLVALVVIPSIVAPLPGPPAEPEPVLEPPLLVPGEETTPTVGVLVRLAPAVAVADDVDVELVSVPPDVTVLDGAAALLAGTEGVSVGKVNAPVPTCPPLSIPEVGTLAGPVVGVAPLVCAATGCAATSDKSPTNAIAVFMLRQRSQTGTVPDRDWPRR
jgi:hypothetical protein